MTSNIRRNFGHVSVSVLFMSFIATASPGQTSYQTEIEDWREQREITLKRDDGWLTVAGLFWLKEGTNSFGTADGNDIVLPAGSVPAKIGVFELRDGKIMLRIEDGVTVTSKGQPIRELEVQSDATKTPDLVGVGDLTLSVIKRGARYGVRVRDMNSRPRREFTGLRWHPVQESYRVKAKFISYERPQEIAITNVIDDTVKMQTPGVLVFQLRGQEYRLQPVTEGDKLFILFRDLTSGKTTYGARRYLYADAPKDGHVTLDFNRAINPPCAFTAFATCPLPPKQNRLNVRVEAGEQTYRAAKTTTAGTTLTNIEN